MLTLTGKILLDSLFFDCRVLQSRRKVVYLGLEIVEVGLFSCTTAIAIKSDNGVGSQFQQRQRSQRVSVYILQHCR